MLGVLLSSALCGRRALGTGLSGASDAVSSFNDNPPKSTSKSRSSRVIEGFCLLDDRSSSEIVASSFPSTSRESGPASMVDVCFRPDPLGLRDDERRDEVESFDTSDSVDPLGECPGRCDVT